MVNLSARETQVLDGIMHAKSHKVIAREIGIEWRTVETHTRNVRRKMGAKTTLEMVVRLFNEKLAHEPR